MKLVVHPAADVFPMMSEDELKEMKKSITAFGLRENIGTIQNPENVQELLVLDGRNRWHALASLGVKEDVIIREFTTPIDLDALGATPEEYVLMANIERRMLTQSQRRGLAGKLAVMYEERQKNLPKEQKEDSLSKAAEAAGVSRRTAATAKRNVLKEAGSEKPTPVLKDGDKKKKDEPHVPAKNVISRLEWIIESMNKHSNTWPTESFETIAKYSQQIVVGVSEKLQARADKAAAEAQAAANKIAAAAAEGDSDN